MNETKNKKVYSKTLAFDLCTLVRFFTTDRTIR